MFSCGLVLLLITSLAASSRFDQDFENGASPYWSIGAWGPVTLEIQNVVGGPAPQTPSLGQKYLASKKTVSTDAGTAYYQSQFSENPGGVVLTFDYWMKSAWDRGNVIEVLYKKNGVDVTLAQFFSSLQAGNRWFSARVEIPADAAYSAVLITLYTAGNPGDACAIDNIALTDPTATTTTVQPTTTVTTTTPTTTRSTTESTTTTERTTTTQATTTTTQSTTKTTESTTTTAQPTTTTTEPTTATTEPSTTTEAYSSTRTEQATNAAESTVMSTLPSTVQPSTTVSEEQTTRDLLESTAFSVPTEERSTSHPSSTIGFEPSTSRSTHGASITSERPDESTVTEVVTETPWVELTTEEQPETTQEPEVTEGQNTTNEVTEEPAATDHSESTTRSNTTNEVTEEPAATNHPESTTRKEAETTDLPEEPTTTGNFTTMPVTSSSTESASTSTPSQTVTSPRTTTIIQTTTTAPPPGNVTFDFGISTSDWSLNDGNGAAWVRRSGVAGVPAGRNGYLWLSRNSFYAGLLTTDSPLLQAGPGIVTIEIDFWINGTRDDPAQLQVFIRSADYVYNPKPVLDLNGFGNRPNYGWSKVAVRTIITQPDRLFQIVVQGALGQSYTNRIAVAGVKVSGAGIVTWPTFWDIPNGSLNGWTTGTSQGAIWRLGNESDAITHSMPLSENGGHFLMVEKFAARPGYVTMQSPALTATTVDARIGINFWLRGTTTSPADLTVRIRLQDGELVQTPVLDLRPFSTSDTMSWVYVDAPLSQNIGKFQLVLEAFIGTGETNGIAVNDISFVTVEDGKIMKNSLFKF